MLKFGRNFFSLQEVSKGPFLTSISVLKNQASGIKFYKPKEPIDSSEWPEHRRLRPVEKVPPFHTKTLNMRKMIKLLRGPESVHNELIYKGFGVKALLGGRLMFEHFERIRQIVNPKINQDRMFAVWRVDSPWQPLCKKGPGKKLGGGKGSVHHYCTPVKANRIIVEVGGDLHEIEALKILAPIVEVLPFLSRFVRQKDLEYEKANQEWVEKSNKNPYTMEYVIRNNMGGCQNFLSKYDYEWFGKYK